MIRSPLFLLAVIVFCFDGICRGVEKSIPAAAREIDDLLAKHWQTHHVTPNAPLNDETFVRRIYLDLAGRIPTTTETQTFLQSQQPKKRAALIDDLLTQESYVSHFYNYWADVLRFKSHYVNRANVVEAAYEIFLKDSLRQNKSYDQLVYELLSAKGYAWNNGAIGYYHRDPDMPLDNMALTSRVFLGTRIECAQCHNHPFDRWKQTDFYHLAAFTIGNTRVNEAFGGARDAIRAREQVILDDFKREKAASKDNGKAAEQRKQQRMEAMEYRKIVGIIKSPVGQLFSPIGLERRDATMLKLPPDYDQDEGQPGDVMAPAPLMSPAAKVSPGDDPAAVFAKWVTSPENPRFTKVIVNRLWKKMFGLAITENFDDLKDDSQAMVPELESHLEKLLIAQKYDLRAFLAVLANTRVYQSVVSEAEHEPGELHHFPGPLLRRMTAEQIWDSLVALANHEPDARETQHEHQIARRIAISQMACEAYLNFDGEKLVAMAYARLQAEKELEARIQSVREALIVAKRNNDQAKTVELRHREGDLDRERNEALVRDFLMPILTHLAQTKNGPAAEPRVDQFYVINTNPRVLAVETWRRMYITGYGPEPLTPEKVAAESEAKNQLRRNLAMKLGLAETQHQSFVAYCEQSQREWKRASELESPAPRGHFLRTMGQSDRDFVENANPNAAISQALALMNSDLITEQGLLSKYSPLMHFTAQAKSPDAAIEAVYVAILSRKPTATERATCSQAFAKGLGPKDLVHSLLNTKQFLFIQ